MKLLSQAEKLLIDEQGLVPLFFLSSHNIVSSRVKDWKDNVMNIHPSRFTSVERGWVKGRLFDPSVPKADLLLSATQLSVPNAPNLGP